jgi:plasmid stabilization system protein ParE
VKLLLTPRAVGDLQELRAYIARENPSAASVVGNRLDRMIALIAERPDIGRPTKYPDVREWSVPGLPYVIPYRVRAGTVEILRVWHTRREQPSQW